MKLATLWLAAPLALGWGVAVAQTTTSTTESTTSQPSMPPSDSSVIQHTVTGDGTTIDRRSGARQNPDGSVTTDHSKTITR
jgi:hypothetical protein